MNSPVEDDELDEYDEDELEDDDEEEGLVDDDEEELEDDEEEGGGEGSPMRTSPETPRAHCSG